MASMETDPCGKVLKSEQRARVRTLLGELPKSEREVLVVKYLDNMSNSVCAAVRGVSVAAVKKCDLRAILHFRELADAEST